MVSNPTVGLTYSVKVNGDICPPNPFLIYPNQIQVLSTIDAKPSLFGFDGPDKDCPFASYTDEMKVRYIPCLWLFTEEHACDCNILQLMKTGCQCGGV